MQYRNKRTGAIIDIPGVITGDVWERVEPKAKPKKVEEPKEATIEEPIEETTKDEAPKKRSKKK